MQKHYFRNAHTDFTIYIGRVFILVCFCFCCCFAFGVIFLFVGLFLFMSCFCFAFCFPFSVTSFYFCSCFIFLFYLYFVFEVAWIRIRQHGAGKGFVTFSIVILNEKTIVITFIILDVFIFQIKFFFFTHTDKKRTASKSPSLRRPWAKNLSLTVPVVFTGNFETWLMYLAPKLPYFNVFSTQTPLF